MGLKDRMCWPVPILTWGIWGQSSDGGDDGETTQFEGRQGDASTWVQGTYPVLGRMSWSRELARQTDGRGGRECVSVAS